MPVAPARPRVATAGERERLKKMAYGRKTPYRLRRRAEIVLHAARGRSHARIARETRPAPGRRCRGPVTEVGLHTSGLPIPPGAWTQASGHGTGADRAAGTLAG